MIWTRSALRSTTPARQYTRLYRAVSFEDQQVDHDSFATALHPLPSVVFLRITLDPAQRLSRPLYRFTGPFNPGFSQWTTSSHWKRSFYKLQEGVAQLQRREGGLHRILKRKGKCKRLMAYLVMIQPLEASLGGVLRLEIKIMYASRIM